MSPKPFITFVRRFAYALFAGAIFDSASLALHESFDSAAMSLSDSVAALYRLVPADVRLFASGSAPAARAQQKRHATRCHRFLELHPGIPR